jgi:hypothetical protein
LRILFVGISVQDARSQRSSSLPPEESIGTPALSSFSSSRKEFRDVKRNHLPLDSLDILQEEADEEVIELKTITESKEAITSRRPLPLMSRVGPAYCPSRRVFASVESHRHRFLPHKLCSHAQLPSPIIEETIIDDDSDRDHADDDEQDMQHSVVRCKSLDSLRGIASPAPDTSDNSRQETRKTRSLNDLTILEADMELEIVKKTDAFCTPAMRRLNPRLCCSLHSCFNLESISKEEVMSRWKESERELLNVLQTVLHEKRALEERLLLLHRVLLLKPP